MVTQIFYCIVLIILILVMLYVIKSGKYDQYAKVEELINSIVYDAVKTTNQIFVEDMKEQGLFDEEAQKEAYQITKESVEACLTESLKKILSKMVDDVDTYIKNKIESTVNVYKE